MMRRETAMRLPKQGRAGAGIVRRRRLAGTLALLGVIAAACGGGDDDNASSDSTGATSSSTAVSSSTTEGTPGEVASGNASGDEISGSATADAAAVEDASVGNDSAGTAQTDDDTSGQAPTTATTLVPPTTVELGNINETVPGQPQPTEPPVAIDEPAETESGISASITGVEAIETQANLPGEIGGPGVAITIELRNGSAAPIDLNNVVVDLVLPGDVSATPITEGSEPFTGVTAAGAAQTATYVFTVDAEERGDVTIRITYSADQPVVVFAGSIA
jgi:hypothetical protein